jgi:hypothetical protein
VKIEGVAPTNGNDEFSPTKEMRETRNIRNCVMAFEENLYMLAYKPKTVFFDECNVQNR